MDFSRYVVAVAAASLLGSSGLARADDAQWTRVNYSCGAGTDLTVYFKPGGGAVRVQAGDKDEVRLVARSAAEGSRFGDSRHELRINGDKATWKVDQKTPLDCATVEGNAARLSGVESP